jgi:small redox-active disulfide protein 2
MNRTIKILGTGCPKCKKALDIVKEIVSENNIDATIEKVDDIMEIIKYNVISTPTIVIDEKLMIVGRVPSKSELIEILSDNK